MTYQYILSPRWSWNSEKHRKVLKERKECKPVHRMNLTALGSRCSTFTAVRACVCHEFHETCHSVTFYFMKNRLQTMLWHRNARVNSHQRWKQTRFRVCFHLWCELTSTMNVTERQVSWNSCLPVIKDVTRDVITQCHSHHSPHQVFPFYGDDRSARGRSKLWIDAVNFDCSFWKISVESANHILTGTVYGIS